MKIFSAAALYFCAIIPGFAVQLCTDGLPRGSISDSASPEENLQCELIGRSFCIIEEDRLAGLPKESGVNRAAKWLGGLGSTGTHQKNNDKAVLVPVADFIYGHDKMLPWTAYWYSVYGCGFNKRVTTEQARIASPKWDAAAMGCVKQFPGQGDGSINDPLRTCLDSAMSQVVAEAKAAPRQTAARH